MRQELIYGYGTIPSHKIKKAQAHFYATCPECKEVSEWEEMYDTALADLADREKAWFLYMMDAHLVASGETDVYCHPVHERWMSWVIDNYPLSREIPNP